MVDEEMAPAVVEHPEARTKRRSLLIEHRVHSETLADDPFPAEGCPVRLYACAGCAERSPRRDLVECVEGNHDDLTYFHGDVLCRAYADGAGVEY